MTGAVEVRRLVIPGEPYAKQRPRARALGKGRATIYTPPETKAAELAVALAWAELHAGYVPTPGARHGLRATFYRYARYRRDGDNLLKLLLDGLNGHAWEDDYQVEDVHYSIRWVEKADARTELATWELGTVPHLLGVDPATLEP